MAFHPRQFLRMAIWARYPPSTRRVIMVLAIIAVCIALSLIERVWAFPTWLTPNSVPSGRI